LRVRDAILLAAGAMSDRRTRTALTIIGLVIGPAAIVALVGATQGYSNASAAQFQKLGATTIFVSGVDINFTQADLNEIQGLSGVSAVVPYETLSGSMDVAGTSENVQIIATNIAELEAVIPDLSLQQGTLPPSSDLTGSVIGSSIAYPDVQGASNVSVDQVITVSGISADQFLNFAGGGVQVSVKGASPAGNSGTVTRSFIVSGIYNAFGQGFAQISPDGTIFVPIAVAQGITHTYTYTNLLVAASSAKVANQVASEITDLFGSSKVSADTLSSILSTLQSVNSGISTLLEAVAGISVLVAFIGIMTTMFTSVLERTKEIGIMKALGASGRNIMLTFLSEALLTGFIGGLIGAGAGSALSFVMITLLTELIQGSGGSNVPSASPGGSGASSTAALNITPAITPELILFAIVLATAVGMLAGLYPAWRASKMPPVDALRSV
jgi:putative ABC transport system permease protein